jgi:hypothetical protein
MSPTMSANHVRQPCRNFRVVGGMHPNTARLEREQDMATQQKVVGTGKERALTQAHARISGR